MKHLNKIIISLLSLIVIISAVYYFAFKLPEISERKFVLAQQEKCRDAGDKAYKADLKQYNADSLDEPEYSYNKTLNTCLYFSGYKYEGNRSSGQSKDIFTHNCDASWELWVKDAYSNKKIISVMNFNSNKCEWMTHSDTIDKFWKEKNDLFGEKEDNRE